VKFAVLVFILAAALVYAEPRARTLKAKVEEPVLQELMGGCSMRCAFPWTVEVAENGKAKVTKVLNDEKADTAWTASAGNGIGVKFRLAFPKRLPGEMEGEVPFYGLDLVNGIWRSEELWRQHGRVKRARLFYNERHLGDVTFADSRRWQRVIFDDVMVRSGDVLTLEVLEVYPGDAGGLAISEIVLQGAH
jgi:hypothetical protein